MRILSRTSSAATLVALSLAACADVPEDEPRVAEDGSEDPSPGGGVNGWIA